MKKSRFHFLPVLCIAIWLVLACRSEQKLISPKADGDAAASNAEPNLFTLLQNSPNPFSSSTLIRFELKKTLVVTLRVSLQSHTVILFSGVKDGPATHYVVYEPEPFLPNGNYRYSLEANGVYQQRAMTLQR